MNNAKFLLKSMQKYLTSDSFEPQAHTRQAEKQFYYEVASATNLGELWASFDWLPGYPLGAKEVSELIVDAFDFIATTSNS